MNEFIEHCENTNIIPDDYNVIKYFDISTRTLDRYFGDIDKDTDNSTDNDNSDELYYRGFGEAIKKLVFFREHYLSQLSIDNPKTIGRTNFQQKQGRWGKWSDKQESSNSLSIDLKINGQAVQ